MSVSADRLISWEELSACCLLAGLMISDEDISGSILPAARAASGNARDIRHSNISLIVGEGE
jgi:hypothetical protein